jgi:hypothetical protein
MNIQKGQTCFDVVAIAIKGERRGAKWRLVPPEKMEKVQLTKQGMEELRLAILNGSSRGNCGFLGVEIPGCAAQ